MKTSLLLLMAIITIIVTSLFWLSIFHNLPISEKTDDWSNFGSYLGGVAGPALSFISILLVIETIKKTQQNHQEQVKLIIQEQTYSKLQDLCNYLERTLKNSKLDIENDEYKNAIREIKTNVIFNRHYSPASSLVNKLATAIEETTFYLDKYRPPIDDIAIIIRSVIKFIFAHDNNDKELMVNMIELKITKEQRFLIFMLMKSDYPQDIHLIQLHWNTFFTYPWGD